MAPENIPYIAHEGEVTRLCGIIHKLTAIIILLILLLVGSNVGWIIYEAQFEDVVTTTESYNADATDGGNAILNGDGSVNVNGIGECNENNHEEENP